MEDVCPLCLGKVLGWKWHREGVSYAKLVEIGDGVDARLSDCDHIRQAHGHDRKGQLWTFIICENDKHRRQAWWNEDTGALAARWGDGGPEGEVAL